MYHLLHLFYFNFLHCAFSNVCSNGLPEKRHSHIDCICLAFLHYVFSNASSNYLHLRMQSRIGCICLAFLHCAFSNVPSNSMPLRMQSRIGCICLTFPNVRFLMCIQIACLRRGIVARAHEQFHWSHLKGFSPECSNMCFMR